MATGSRGVSRRRALLDWFDKARRPLPWRATDDAYAIWVSEIMLQQTTVRTVEPRWRRFLERFPDVTALANAPLDDVVAEWSGLGYYTRARNLHAAARRIAAEFQGRIPREFEVLLSLPGMGRYTAAAVASIAFGEPVAVVDANVERVLARWDAIADPVSTTATKRRLWERAQEVLDPARPGDWNQAMMELGALVCLPRAPQCAACPVAQWCQARASGDPGRFPVKAPKSPMQAVREVAACIQTSRGVLLLRRSDSGTFAGMWELPRGVANEHEQGRDAVVRIVRELTGIDVVAESPMLRLRHTVMRSRIELTVWKVRPTGSTRVRRTQHVAHDWVRPDEVLDHPASTTQRAVLHYLATGRLPRGGGEVDDLGE